MCRTVFGMPVMTDLPTRTVTSRAAIVGDGVGHRFRLGLGRLCGMHDRLVGAVPHCLAQVQHSHCPCCHAMSGAP